MESTEDCPNDGIMGSEHLTSSEQFSIAKYEDCVSDVSENVESVEDTGQQVYGYLSVSEDTENATIIIQPQVIECGTQRLIIAQAEEGNEIYVVVSGDQDQQLVQSPSQNSVIHPDVILESISKHEISHAEECTQDFQYIQTEEKVVEDDASNQTSNVINNEGCNETAVWTFKGNVPNQENTEMVFIPAQTILSSSQVLTPEESKHRKLMQLACIAHEMRSVDPSVVANSTENTELSNSTLEESVIAIQQPLELEQHSSSSQNKSDEDSASNNCINENSGNELSEAGDNQSEELSTNNLSEYPQYKSRIIDNAVSVIHSPPTYNVAENCSTSCTKSDSINDKENCNQTEDVSYFSDSNEQTFNLNSECKLSIDEDSNTMSSQTSGLDLTIDSKIHYSSETEETHFGKEESKPDFYSQTIIKRNLECENNINSESEGRNTDSNLSRNISPILVINNECNEKSMTNDKICIENDSFVEDVSVGVVCENPPDEQSIDASSDGIQYAYEVLGANSPKLNSEVSNESCNTPSSSSALKGDLNKNDLIFEKNKVTSLSQECQLPKKKFRIQPDLEKEIAEICNSKNGSLCELKEYIDSGELVATQNTEVSRNLQKVSSNKVEDNEEPKEYSKHSLVGKPEVLNIQNTEDIQNLRKVSSKEVKDNEEPKEYLKHSLICESEILNIQNTEVTQNLPKDYPNKVNDSKEPKECSKHSLVDKSEVLNIQIIEVSQNLPDDSSMEVKNNEEPKEYLKRSSICKPEILYIQNTEVTQNLPKDSPNKVKDSKEPKECSKPSLVGKSEVLEPRDSSKKINDNEEPKEYLKCSSICKSEILNIQNTEVTQNLPKDSPIKVNDSKKPKECSKHSIVGNSEVHNIQNTDFSRNLPKDSSNKVEDSEETKECSKRSLAGESEVLKIQNTEFSQNLPKDSLNNVNDNKEPKEWSQCSLVGKSEVLITQNTEVSQNLPEDSLNKIKDNGEPKECSKHSLVDKSEVLNMQNTEVSQNLPKDSLNQVKDNEEPKESVKNSLIAKSEVLNIKNADFCQNLPKDSSNKVNDNEEPKESSKRSLVGKPEVHNIQNTDFSQNLPKDSSNKVEDSEEIKGCSKRSLVGKSEVLKIQNTDFSQNLQKDSLNKINDNEEPKECLQRSLVGKAEVFITQNTDVSQNLPKDYLNKVKDNGEPKECSKHSLVDKSEVLNIQCTEVSQNLPKDSSNQVKDDEEPKESVKNSLVDMSEIITAFQTMSKPLNNKKENSDSEAEKSVHICEENHETVEQIKKLGKDNSSAQDVSSTENQVKCEKTQSNTFAMLNSGASNINNNNSLGQKEGTDVCDALLEENLVKPPKVTYASRKRKRNLFQNDVNSPKEPRYMFSSDDEIVKKDNCNENGMTLKGDVLSSGNDVVDDDFTPSNIKVSLNYTRKRKNVSPVMEETENRNSRKKTRCSTGSDLLDTDSKSDTSASTNEVTNWGNILLSTSFQSIESDRQPDSQCPPSLCSPKPSEITKEKLVKPVNKVSSKSEAQWQKFMKSTSPKKVKRPDKKLRDKVKRQVRSLCKSGRFTSQFADSIDPFSKIEKKINQTPNKKKQLKSSKSNSDKKNNITIPVKKSGIKYLNDKQPSTSSSVPNLGNSSTEKEFNCPNCSFSTNRVNNIIAHMKYCSNKEPLGRLLDYSVDDMDRRQRIRGEDVMESWYERELNESFLLNGSSESDMNEPSCSSLARALSADDSDDDEMLSNNKSGYKEKSVVWVQRKKGYWPALIWRLDKGKACVYLISTPETHEMLKVDFKKLHSFDDAKWNNQLLKQANKYRDKDNFVKAVQKCQSYLNKKLLGQRRIDVRSFFKIADNAKFSDSEDDEDSNLPNEYKSCISDDEYSEDSLDPQCIADCILQGTFDDELVSIYKKQTPNEKHANFFKKSSKDQLVYTASFGPFKKNADMDRVLTHLDELFLDNIGEKPHKTSYIYEVWIPEAITKAISVIKHVTLEEAKTIFYNTRPE